MKTNVVMYEQLNIGSSASTCGDCSEAEIRYFPDFCHTPYGLLDEYQKPRLPLQSEIHNRTSFQSQSASNDCRETSLTIFYVGTFSRLFP